MRYADPALRRLLCPETEKETSVPPDRALYLRFIDRFAEAVLLISIPTLTALAICVQIRG